MLIIDRGYERPDWLASAPRLHTGDDDATFPAMIGLSVAVGRFVEALFWAIARAAGAVTVAVVAAALVVIAIVAAIARHRRDR